MDRKVELSRKSIVIITVVLILGALIGTLIWREREDQRRAEEIATAEGLARVIRSTFSGKTDLRVSNVSGTIDVKSVNRGWIFDSELKATLPFSVDYYVDLSALSLDKVRYDRKTRTLFVEVPDVRVAEPNINLAKGSVGDINGWWVSREASTTLIKRAVKLTNQKAAEEAGKTENIERARAEGRERISGILELPLKSTGMENVNVVVRYPPDNLRSDERWDVSRSIQEVLDEAAQRRAGEKSQ